MRIGIISDIHSNLEALETALEVLSARKVDELVCLGDIVGYGANPNECLAMVCQATRHVIIGNHDEAAASFSGMDDFNPTARRAAEWTRARLTEENKEIIRKLPFTIELGGALFVHASPNTPYQWSYIITLTDAVESFNHFSTPICFIGHSHVPGILSDAGWEREVVREKKFIVNVGSVGQPRDGDPRLSCGFFDTEEWKYENIRSAYDAEKASEKIIKAGLPGSLAGRILIGR